jgi:hypothetical protein
LEESDNLDDDNGQDGTEPAGQVNAEMDLAELQEQEEIRQELEDLKDSDDEELYPGLKGGSSP